MKYWATKEGNKLLIKEMETSHIENCIKMLERTRPDFETEINGADEHGFNLTSFVMQETAEKWDSTIKALKNELKRR